MLTHLLDRFNEKHSCRLICMYKKIKNIKMFTICAIPGLLFKMIELTKNMRQKDDQPFTELLNRFRTASQTEGDIQCIQSRLVHPKDTDYPVSIVLYFWDSFSYISCLFFISLNCFFSNSIFFLCWLHCFIALFFFYI